MKHKYKTRGSLVAALDIGSTKIVCFIGRVVDDNGDFEVLGVGNQRSAGIKNGTIVDLNAAETAIRQAVNAAENMAAEAMKSYPLRDIVVSLPGIHARSFLQKVQIKILGHEITDNDVRRALGKAQESSFSEEYELVHTIPVGYRIDGHEGVSEPRGMYGQMMDVDIHIVTGDVNILKNMANVIERSHLDIRALCLSSYAAGLSSLVDDEMELGCTLIDMGGGTTSFAFFHNHAMVYADSIPMGGQHVTSDIAKGLTTSLVDAERLKILYGSAMGAVNDSSELIDVPKVGEEEGSGPNHIPRSLLVGIIQPRLEEVFELVRNKISDSGFGPVMGRRVVLTGGASQMPGMRDLASHVLDKQVRLGRPIRVTGLPDAVSGPAFATVSGLVTYLAQCSDEMPGDIMAQIQSGSTWERLKFWFKENW